MLVGDAANGVDPILAQGAGGAVEDACHLARAQGGGRDGGVVEMGWACGISSVAPISFID